LVRQRGTAHETRQKTVEQPPGAGWARLLDPRLEVVGFVGREVELAALTAWCEGDNADRLRLITGPGGVGKTRLTVELMQRMRGRGWRCERVADRQEGEAIAALRATIRKRALLVVDYAETRTGLRAMLTALAREDGAWVRVLLLARSAGEWWEQLGVGQLAVWDLVKAAKAAELVLTPEVAASVSDAEVIAAAVTAFAKALGVPERTVQLSGGSDKRRRMLDLHATALVAVLREPGSGPVQIDIGAVLDELLRHEMHYWYDSAQASQISQGLDGLTAAMVRQLVAAGCLLGAATQNEAGMLTGRVPGVRSSVKVARWLRDLYPPEPGESDWLGSLQPDRLAELHTVTELAAAPDLARSCLQNLDARQARRAVTLLARASFDDPNAEALLSQALPDVADFIADLDAPIETLSAIYNAIPYPSVILAKLAALLAQRITSALPANADPAQRSLWLSNLGIWLAALGRRASALRFIQEVVDLRRELAAADPDRYRPDLATSLNNLGVAFGELGRPAEALPVTEEAVDLCRELAAVNPDRYRPDLAQSLANLGVWLAALGRPADALRVAQEAVDLYRELAAVNPDRYRPTLASSLSNLGGRFRAL
jgi:tetratricopeptide (TPR) repeat protein